MSNFVFLSWWTLSTLSSHHLPCGRHVQVRGQRSAKVTKARSDGKHCDTEVTLSLKPVFLGEWSCSSLPNLLWRFDFAICFSRVKRPMHVIFAWYLTKLWSCGWDVLSKSLHQQFDLERIWGGCLKWKYKKCNLCTKKYAPLSHLQPHTHTHTHTHTQKKTKKFPS